MPGFESRYPIAVSQTELGWLVTHTVTYVSAVTGRTYRILGQRSTTDFASMPGLLLWLIRPWKVIDPTIPPAALHDEFWRVLVPRGEMTYREADRVFREALIYQGVDLFTVWSMWAGVRLGALTRGREGRRGWWRDAVPVLLISAGLLVLASTTVFQLLPMAVVWFLKRLLPGRPPVVHGPVALPAAVSREESPL